MLCTGYTKVWDLSPNEFVAAGRRARHDAARHERHGCGSRSRTTQRDIVLSAGDSYTIDRGGLTLIEAQGAAAVCVLAHHVDGDPASGGRLVAPATRRRARGSRRCSLPTTWADTHRTTERHY